MENQPMSNQEKLEYWADKIKIARKALFVAQTNYNETITAISDEAQKIYE